METHTWITLTALGFTLLLLAFTRIHAELALGAALLFLTLAGIVSPERALSGFSNPNLASIAALFIVTGGLYHTGAIALIARKVLGAPRSLFRAQIKLTLPTALLSAFVNNTPIVSVLIPVIRTWAKGHQLSPTKLLMPMNQAAILGGLCTLVGTSTNLIVDGLLRDQLGTSGGLGFFEISKVGIPCALAGLAYIYVTHRYLLPDRTSPSATLENAREYIVEMTVEEDAPFLGQSIEAAGLRHLSGLFLIEIERGGQILSAVSADTLLQAGDHLVFAGVVESVIDLQKMKGLRPATRQVFKLDTSRSDRHIFEVVISDSFPEPGKTIRDLRFRHRYGAVVLAVRRNGARIGKRLGDVVPLPGDTLLLEAPATFSEQFKYARDFYLVSHLNDAQLPRHERAGLALMIFLGMVVLAATGLMPLLSAAWIAVGLMLSTRCITRVETYRSLNIQVLALIGISMGLGGAISESGAAHDLGGLLLRFSGDNPYIALFALYGLTMLLSELVANSAAAVIAFPIAWSMAGSMSINPMPFVMALTIAASCGFATPMGYQTNMMIYGAGAYRFSDFLRFGGGLNLVVWLVTCLLAPMIWPF